MSSNLSIRIASEPVRSLAFGSISGVYAGIGTEMARSIRMLMVKNLTNQVVMMSFDGVEDSFPMASNEGLILDITTNKVSEQGFFLGQGERLYVKDTGTACTVGSVYVSVFYGEGD